jgi:predicted transcriptional regulator
MFMRQKRYGSQINIAISNDLKATLDMLSEERKESISDIARRGLEREIAKLMAKQKQVGEIE